ncbi:aspartyl/asparaginyl beta-hydroxylase domain-containing protein [Nostoc sp. CALU 1950]|uniref:aspartyl/asparaginyl beta-hydroxylase domain-containing protein n=1 Tax=Nostoc sp. CALU 1950 TaxID=3104321 RepID=UPI003EBFC135
MTILEDSILPEYKQSLPRQQILSESDNRRLKILFSLLAMLNFLFPKSNISRFEKSIKFYFGLIDINNEDCNPHQKPNELLYLGITSKPWYECCDYHVLKFVSDRLEKGAKDIEHEWSSNRLNKHSLVSRCEFSDVHPDLKEDDWGEFVLWKEGKFTKAARSIFPRTVKIVSNLESFVIPFGQVVFLVLKPGVSLPPHHDASNIDLTCQLGLIIPENCGIRVGSETRSWTEGQTLFFDHSFEHEAWNKSDKERVVLLLDLYHPELTRFEKFLLWFLGKVFLGY